MLQIEDLQRYLPRLQQQRLIEHHTGQHRAPPEGHPEAAERHRPQICQGAILTIDISGFSVLSENLCRQGPRGVETLSSLVRHMFGTVTDLSLDHGGDVLYFAGDAVAVHFPAVQDEPLSLAVVRACMAGRAAIDMLNGRTPVPGFSLRLRAAVGAGSYSAMEVGGTDGRWVFLVTGPAVVDARLADAAGSPGKLTISQHAAEQARLHLTLEALPNGIWRVLHVNTPAPVAPLAMLSIPQSLLAALEHRVPPSSLHRLRADIADVKALFAEFRPITAIFMSLPGFDLHDEQQLRQLQAIVVIVQEELHRRGGVLHSVLGDKGTGFVGMFGLPPQAHDDDAVRALDTALAIAATVAASGVKVQIGVASGPAYLGESGAARRRGYDVFGSTMVLAARLMQQATADGLGGLICCERTRRLAERNMEFDELPPLRLKGFAEPVGVARPRGRRDVKVADQAHTIGRQPEIRMLAQRLDALVHAASSAAGAGPDQAASDGAASDAAGSVLILSAEAGMGKTTLVHRFRDLARDRGVSVLFGRADAVESRTPYFAIRGVLQGLLGLGPGLPAAEARRRAEQRLDSDAPELAWMAPLLNSILALDFPETAATGQILIEVRAERLGDLFVALMQAHCRRAPCAVVVEDLHWADLPSWTLLRRAADSAPLFLLGTCRPIAVPPPELAALTTGERRTTHTLCGLSPSESEALICRRLGVAAIPASFARFIHQRAEGNPFFTEEMALSAVEAELVSIEAGSVVVENLAASSLPTTVAGVITSRIDRLSVAAQATLKVAAIVGRSFERAALLAIHPIATVVELLDSALSALIAGAFIAKEEGQEDVWYFRHALIQESTYSLVPFADRRSLHHATARYLESRHAADLSSDYALLAHHYSMAEAPKEAAEYNGKAAVQALDAYANQACVEYLTAALRFDEQARGQLLVDSQRAKWCRMMAQAWYSLSRHDLARKWTEETWKYAGFAAPRFGSGTPAAILSHIWGRYVPPVPITDPERRAGCQAALVAADNLMTIYQWAGSQGGVVHTAFAADNIGQRCKPSGGSSMVRRNVGLLLVMVGLHKIGLRDLEEALAMAEGQGEFLPILSNKIIYGISLSLLGRMEEALPFLHAAAAMAAGAGSGLWRHRAKFQLAEAYLMLGRYQEAANWFARGVPVALTAEPPASGFGTAEVCLCELRLGRDPGAVLEKLDGPLGMPLAEKAAALLRYVALGVRMQVLLAAGRLAEAHQVATAALKLAAAGSDTYSYARGMDGHVGTALVLLRLWEHQKTNRRYLPGVPAASTLKAESAQALKHLKKCARIFPCAEPAWLLLRGIEARLLGRLARAEVLLGEAALRAGQLHEPWEEAMAMFEHSRVLTGPMRRWRLMQAEARAARMGLAALQREIEEHRQAMPEA